MRLYELNELFELFIQNGLPNLRMTLEECESLMHNKVIIFGAGNSGIVLYRRLKKIGIDVFAFWDNKGSIYGDHYDNISIYDSKGINRVIDPDDSYVVFVTLFDIMSFDKIKNDLVLSWDGPKENLKVLYFTQLRNYTPVFSIDNTPCFSAYLGENLDGLVAHKSDIFNVYNLLNDAESKKVYTELFNYFFIYDFVDFTIHPFEDHYFDFLIYKKIENEVFVDCGAYDGDTLDIFRQHNKSFKKYIAIEADKINYLKLKRKIGRIDNNRVVLFDRYISDSIKEIGFDSEGTSYSNSDNGQTKVLAISLDELVYRYEPTFIKINIEGADLDAIRGAKQIITDFHPIVACQGHHKMEHLWEIVEIIEDFGKCKYNYFLRNYSGITEYTFYAIPSERVVERF